MSEFLSKKITILKEKKIPNPEIDLRVMLNNSKLKNKEIIFSDFKLEQINVKKFNSLFERRLLNEPISKIINKKSFWKDNFFVNHHVLDPRPETEGIIEESIRVFKNRKIKIKILDIGTGSGAIAISLAREFCDASIVAIDISKQALKVAKKNIIDKRLQNRINLKNTTIDLINEDFDLIVSNPPYISKNELSNISREIRDFEPLIALDGGIDGLMFYRDFAINVPRLMKPNSYFIFEIGETQFDACGEIFANSLLKFEKKVLDLQKKDRIMIFSKI